MISLPLFSYRYLPTAIGCSTVAHAWPALDSLLSSILGHLSFLPAYKVPLLPLTPALHLPLFSYRFYFPTALFSYKRAGKSKHLCLSQNIRARAQAQRKRDKSKHFLEEVITLGFVTRLK